MRRIEYFMNWLTDMDWGWEPYLSLRPPKDRDIDNRIILKLARFFGCGPALIVFLGAAFEHIRPFTVLHVAILLLLGCALVLLCFVGFFVIYKFTFAYFWNCRARRLRSGEHE
jgi:hypothetical protein